MRLRVGVLIASVFVGSAAPAALAQTEAERLAQQDRRIEEQKRDELQPSEAPAPPQLPIPWHAQSPAPTGALPIYFLDVSRRFVTYHYDLAKAAVVLRGVDDEYINLEAQLDYLKTERLVPPRLQRTLAAQAPLRKGLFALVLARTLKTRGGVFFRVLPTSQRYALKELVYQGLLSPGSPQDLVSGQEFVSTLARAVDQLARERAPRQAAPKSGGSL